MIALLKKDRVWLLTSLLIGGGIFATVLFDRRPDLIWIGGERRNTEEMILAWWICAGLFGLYAGLRDRLLGTREYLLHRPVGPERVFWTRCFGCLLVMTAAALLPYLLTWLDPFDRENMAIWEFERLWTNYALSTSMWTLFAVGLYAATVPATKVSAVFQTGLVGVPVVFLAWRAMFPFGSSWEVSPWFYVGVQALLAGTLLVLSAKHFARGQDPDQDISPRLKAVNTVLVAVCGILLASIAVSEFQRDAYGALFYAYPRVEEYDDGTFARLKRHWDGERMISEVVDANHEPIDAGENSPRGKVVRGWHPQAPKWPDVERQLEPDMEKDRYGHALGGIRRGIRLSWGAGGGFRSHMYFQLPEGIVEAYGLRHGRRDGSPPPWKRTFKRSDGRPFSPRTRFMQAGGGDDPLFAHDRADRTIWYLTEFADGSTFQGVTLPDGARFESLHSIGTVKATPEFSGSWRSRPAVVGEKGTYIWEKDRFVLLDGSSKPGKRAQQESRVRWFSGQPGTDPFKLRLSVLDDEGKPRFEALYRPRAADERLAALCARIATIPRSPVLVLASLGLEPPGIWPFDPLVTYGGRPWLVALNLAFAGIFVFFARRRLRRFGANTFSLWLWTVLIALGGVAIYIVFRFVERKRAYTPVKVLEPVDIPPLLIHTV